MWKLVDEYFGQFGEDLGPVGDWFGPVVSDQGLVDEVWKGLIVH